MRPNLRCLYLLRTQHENLGDLWINRFLILYIKSLGFEVVVDDFGVPSSFRDEVARGCGNLPSLGELSFCRFKSLKFLISTPAGVPRIVFMPPGHQTPRGLEAFIKRLGSYGLLLALRFRGFRFLQYGMSVEPRGCLERMRLWVASVVMDMEGFRDSASHRLAGSSGLLHPDLILLADEALSKAVDVARRGQIVLSYRWDHCPEGERLAMLEKVVSLVVELKQRWPEANFQVTYQVDRDQGPALELHRRLSERGVTASLIKIESWEEAKAHYGSGSLVLSNRLHVALTSVVVGGIGIATINPELDIKIRGAFDYIGLGEHVVELGKMDFDMVDEAKNEVAWRERLRRTRSLVAQAGSRLRTDLARSITATLQEAEEKK